MANLTQDENSYDDKELRDVIISFVLAGRDTTAVTLSWFTYEMCCHPEIADKIYEEGVAVIGKHTVVESAVEHLTHEALGQMHYLHAALSESLRLHPAVPRVRKSDPLHNQAHDSPANTFMLFKTQSLDMIFSNLCTGWKMCVGGGCAPQWNKSEERRFRAICTLFHGTDAFLMGS